MNALGWVVKQQIHDQKKNIKKFYREKNYHLLSRKASNIGRCVLLMWIGDLKKKILNFSLGFD